MRKEIRKKRNRGFTLIEVVVAMGVFAILMAAVSGIFGATYKAYRETKALQRDVENAQFVMNTLAKQLRTSTIVVYAAAGSGLRFYDHSDGKCLQYQLVSSTKKLRVAEIGLSAGQNPTVDDLVKACHTNKPLAADFNNINSGETTGKFIADLSKPAVGANIPHIGKVTMSFHITEGSHSADIQTTVSLRDYGYVGLQ